MAKQVNADSYYPPVSFYFRIEFPNISGKGADNSFQSVSGLSVEFDVETFKEGGENRFEHRLPTRSKHQNLILKRGLLKDSKVLNWCRDAFESMIISPTDVMVQLLNEKGDPLVTWNIVNAWPVKWSVSDLKSDDNTVVIESLELSYQYFTVL